MMKQLFIFGMSALHVLVVWGLSDKAGNSPQWTFIEHYVQQHSDERPPLEYDRAWLTVNVSAGFDVEIWAQSVECWKCDVVLVAKAPPRNTTTIIVNTTSATDIKFYRISGGIRDEICSFTISFLEHGDYWLFMDYETAAKEIGCTILLANDPMIAEMPILYTALGLFGLAALFAGIFKVYGCYHKGSKNKEGDTADPNPLSDISINQDRDTDGNVDYANTAVEKVEKVEKKKPRLRSLDTLRGISLTVMIFVNYGGGGYWFFEHPPWNGLTVADLVFPWFVFMMGTSMTFSFRGMYRRKMSTQAILFKIVFRSIKLFALGIILASAYGPVDMEKLRIPGVLQRFSLTYLVIALVHFCFHRQEDSHQDRQWAAVRDLVLYIPEWLVHLSLLAVYLCLTYTLPVPGCPTGYTGPGGLSEGGRYQNCTGGAARYIDVAVLGESHIYQFPTPMVIYQTKVPFDPEGILGTLTSIFLCFLGVQAGLILTYFHDNRGRILRWLIWAAITGTIAAILCKGSQNDGWIPLNKNLWSLSFILTTACFAFILLTVLYILIDVLDWWQGQPFIYPGMNSIVVYFCHSIFWRVLPINWLLEPVHWKLLLQDVWGASFWDIRVQQMAYRCYQKMMT